MVAAGCTAAVEVRPGTKTRLWTYAGGVPGPLIRAHVGDRLIVDFTNRLPEETTIHWHGVRLPVAMDGVPQVSQRPVPPGGQFQYSFVLPDAGLFWYHPHVRSAAQVGDGLYGAILVEDPAEPKELGDELVMVLSDMSLGDDGQLLPSDLGGDFGTLFGREGEPVLINGRIAPTLLARPGRRQRWRIVNAARSRYFQLVLPGHHFLRIGGDGGFFETPTQSERLVLIPGERADVLVTPTGEPGSNLVMRWVPYDRGYGSTFMRPDVDVMTMRLVERGATQREPVPARLRAIPPLDPRGARVQEIRLVSQTINGNLTMGVTINGKPASATNMVPAKIGETQVWNVTNEVDFAHPFHIHGFFFQVLSRATLAGDVSPGPLEWKDTSDVPAKGKTSLVVRFDDRPGTWMFHCHILDHAEAGMMAMIGLQP